jgi:MoaA/NifB/PqqE/SkfB family radical SAM enzyme
MRFEDIPDIGHPAIKRPPDKLTSACCDCGEPVRHDVQRCRECYYKHIARGVDRKRTKAAKAAKAGVPVVDPEATQFARMDARFCAAMKAAHPGLERR